MGKRTWLVAGFCLVLWKTDKLSFEMAMPFCICGSNKWEFLLLHAPHPCQHLLLSGFWPFTQVCISFSLLFEFAFPWWYMMQTSCHVFISHLYLSFSEMSVKALSFLFLFRLLVFLSLRIIISLSVFHGVQLLYMCNLCNRCILWGRGFHGQISLGEF